MKISLTYRKLDQPRDSLDIFEDFSNFEIVCLKDIDGVNTLPLVKNNLYFVNFTKGVLESQWFRCEEGLTDLSNEVLKYRKQETIDDI